MYLHSNAIRTISLFYALLALGNDRLLTEASNEDDIEFKPTCQFYLAKSSIPGAGHGIYTTEPIMGNTYLQPKPDAPSIIIHDVASNYAGTVNSLYPDYIWTADGQQGGFEADMTELEETVMGIGSLSNFHPYLYNVKPDITEEYDDTITPRGESVGAGGYSYHPGYTFKASRDIQAGEEIFAHYGDEWLPGRDWGMKVPQEKDYEQASEVVRKTFGRFQNNAVEEFESLLPLIQNVAEIFNERAATLMPNTKQEIQDLYKASQMPFDPTYIEEDGTKLDPIAKQIATSTITPRTVEWIQSNGYCIDNLIPRISTIPDAGRGAFAQRVIKEGEMIIPAPLLQIMDYESLYIFSKEDQAPEMKEYEREPISMQLLVNYCFSHFNTSMVLCPQTNMILMNHCSTRHESFGGDCERYNKNEDVKKRGPNAKVQWGTSFDEETEKWLEMDMEEMYAKTEEKKRGISLEIVATRDILPGDEVFLDYGERWEADWFYYLSTWEPPSTTNYTPLKEMIASVTTFRTLEELELDPYPENILTSCIYWVEEGEYVEDSNDDAEYPEESSTQDGSQYIKSPEVHGWPCNILERIEGNGNAPTVYTVEILNEEEKNPTVWWEKNYPRILTNFPEESISFQIKPYMSDQHLPNPFRSFINIPDEMFPENWGDIEGEDDILEEQLDSD